MLRNYTGPDGLLASRRKCGGAVAHDGIARRRGFSLVELLTVLALVMVLLAATSGLWGGSGSRALEPAVRIARAVEFARAKAVAGNRSVAIRFDWIDNRELAMRFLWSRSGQPAAEVVEVRRSERLKNILISPVIVPSDPAAGLPSHALAADESLVISADGQVYVGTGTKGFPVVTGPLLPLIYLGVQPTRDGRVVSAEKRDVAIVQVQCATGTARVMRP